MSFAVTKGKRKVDVTIVKWVSLVAAQRIYDRLRKRSLRRFNSYEQWWEQFEADYWALMDDGQDPIAEADLWNRQPDDRWSEEQHRAYVQGVRDAIAELEEMGAA